MEQDILGDPLARSMFGISASEAISERICIRCKRSIDTNDWSHDDIDEYVISAICPTCFDTLLQEEEPQSCRQNKPILHIERY